MLEIADNRKKILIGVAVVVVLVLIIQSLSAPSKKKHKPNKGGKPVAAAPAKPQAKPPAKPPVKNTPKKSNVKPVIEGQTLEETRKLAKDKLKRAEMMTREKYAKMQALHPRMPLTLQEYIDEQRKAVLKYESMTLDEWVALSNGRSLREDDGSAAGAKGAKGDEKPKAEEKPKTGDKPADKDKAEKPKADKKADKAEKPAAKSEAKTDAKAVEASDEDEKQ